MKNHAWVYQRGSGVSGSQADTTQTPRSPLTGGKVWIKDRIQMGWRGGLFNITHTKKCQGPAGVVKPSDSVHKLWVIIMALPPTSWKTLGKSHYLAEPHFLACETGMPLKVLCLNILGLLTKLDALIHLKYLLQCVFIRVLQRKRINWMYIYRERFILRNWLM